MSLWQVGIDIQIEARRPAFDPAEQQVLDRIEADHPQPEGEKAKKYQEIFEILLAIPAFKSIYRYDPEFYREIVVTLKRKYEKGATPIELQTELSNHIMTFAMPLLLKSSDEAIVNFFLQFIKVAKHLVIKDPILCMKYMYPEQYGALVFSKYFSLEEMTQMMDEVNLIIIDAYQMVNLTVDTLAAERLIEKVVLQLGEDAEHMEISSFQNREQYQRHCEAVIGFYEVILREKASTTANALRYMAASIEE